MGARIGERLVQAGLVTTAQVEQALRAQVVSDGRLGTNLVDLGFISIDAFAEQLALQHRVPCALTRHFEARDPELQRCLSPELAARWHAVPLGRLDDMSIVVASTDPLDPQAVEELSAALNARVIGAVAPELRVLYWLEAVYGIQRPNRYRRTAPSQRREGDDRRRYASTLGSDDSLPTPGALAKIAVRRVSVPRSEPIVSPESIDSMETALAAMRRATGRDIAGDAMVQALKTTMRGTICVGVLFVVRDELALGWKGFVRGGSDERVEALAVPIHEPGLIGRQFLSGQPYMGQPQDITPLDQALWNHLGQGDPHFVASIPIPIFDTRACMLYAHAAEAVSEPEAEQLVALCQHLGRAFERLVRAAQR